MFMRRKFINALLLAASLGFASSAQGAGCFFGEEAKKLTLEENADKLYRTIKKEMISRHEVLPTRHLDNYVSGVAIYSTNFYAVLHQEVSRDDTLPLTNPQIFISLPFGVVKLFSTKYEPSSQKLAVLSLALDINIKCPKIGPFTATRASSTKDEGKDNYELINQFRVYTPRITPELESLANAIYNIALPHIGRKFSGKEEEVIRRAYDFDKRNPLAREQ